MKISEMTLEQLQDYALELETKNAELTEANAEKDAKYADLEQLNKDLQKRNNKLFMQVEQKGATPEPDGQEGDKEVQSCEDFAREYILGGKKK